MNETEQQAADMVISRMEFLEEIAIAAQSYWNVIEFKVNSDEQVFIDSHQSLGALLAKNRAADTNGQ